MTKRSNATVSKSRPAQAAAPKLVPEQPRPAGGGWQKIFLALAALGLATWLIILLVMAWR
jgi:hypothetical protein